MVFAPEVACTVMPWPPAASSCREKGPPVPLATMEPAVFAVPAPVKVTLLTSKFCLSSVVAKNVVGVFAVMKTSVPMPGMVATVVPAALVHQLVLMAVPAFHWLFRTFPLQ